MFKLRGLVPCHTALALALTCFVPNAQTQVTAAPAVAGDTFRQVFVVPGGESMPALKCPLVKRKKALTPSAPPPAGSANAPAGTSDEEIPLTEEDEKSFLSNALAPPTAEELKRHAPRQESLKALHAQLKDVSQSGVARVGIWGGSHMAAEFFTSEVRKALSERYGAGGPGHVNLMYGRPGIRLPVNALCRHGQWREELAPRGMGTGTIHAGAGLFAMISGEANAGIEVDLSSGQQASQPQHVSLHYLRQPEGGRFEIWMDGQSLGLIDTAGPIGLGVLEVRGQQGLSRLKVQALDAATVTLLGLFAEQSKGVVLDNFGIAGASSNYWTTVQADLLKQIHRDRPYDVVMLAYGTNDVTGKDWDPEAYRWKYQKTLQAMRAIHPQAHCILITPGDRVTRYQVKKTVRAKNGKPRKVVQTHYDLRTFPQRHMQAARIQRELGLQYACATWDMSLEMRKAGGAYALMKQSPAWMANDLIHLTPTGYQEMAKLFNQWFTGSLGPAH